MSQEFIPIPKPTTDPVIGSIPIEITPEKQLQVGYKPIDYEAIVAAIVTDIEEIFDTYALKSRNNAAPIEASPYRTNNFGPITAFPAVSVDETQPQQPTSQIVFEGTLEPMIGGIKQGIMPERITQIVNDGPIALIITKDNRPVIIPSNNTSEMIASLDGKHRVDIQTIEVPDFQMLATRSPEGGQDKGINQDTFALGGLYFKSPDGKERRLRIGIDTDGVGSAVLSETIAAILSSETLKVFMTSMINEKTHHNGILEIDTIRDSLAMAYTSADILVKSIPRDTLVRAFKESDAYKNLPLLHKTALESQLESQILGASTLTTVVTLDDEDGGNRETLNISVQITPKDTQRSVLALRLGDNTLDIVTEEDGIMKEILAVDDFTNDTAPEQITHQEGVQPKDTDHYASLISRYSIQPEGRYTVVLASDWKAKFNKSGYMENRKVTNPWLLVMLHQLRDNPNKANFMAMLYGHFGFADDCSTVVMW